MNKQQIESYNELAQLIMDGLGCNSDEASELINDFMQNMLEALNEGCLSEDEASARNEENYLKNC